MTACARVRNARQNVHALMAYLGGTLSGKYVYRASGDLGYLALPTDIRQHPPYTCHNTQNTHRAFACTICIVGSSSSKARFPSPCPTRYRAGTSVPPTSRPSTHSRLHAVSRTAARKFTTTHTPPDAHWMQCQARHAAARTWCRIFRRCRSTQHIVLTHTVHAHPLVPRGARLTACVVHPHACAARTMTGTESHGRPT